MATVIESEKVKVGATPEKVFKFLEDFNNMDKLLPQDKISDWESDFDRCSFKIQNAAVIPLVKESVEPHSKINIVSGDKAPFKFTLVAHIKEVEGGTEAYLIFEGDINPFLKMMVMKPLTNLFNFMAERLQRIFELI
ncbi:MAG: hypothetical protein MI810_24655 [Flavobacteriales bacterium]|nr:hypothetical protein [Flavobacteriales bacterium]